MSGKTWRFWAARRAAHPDDGDLLAFIRRQPLDAVSSPVLHQHLFDCPRCRQRYRDLADASELLNGALAPAPGTQLYPSLVENVLEVIQSEPGARTASARARARRVGSTARLGAMPIALALLLLAIVVVLTFTLSARAIGLFLDPDTIIPLPLQAVPTPTSHAVTSLVKQPTATPAGPLAQLQLCTTSNDTSRGRMRICGAHFTAGDTLRLTVQTGDTRHALQSTLPADAQGSFQYAWPATNCTDGATVVRVEDLTHALAAPTELHVSQCGLATPVPAKPAATATGP